MLRSVVIYTVGCGYVVIQCGYILCWLWLFSVAICYAGCGYSVLNMWLYSLLWWLCGYSMLSSVVIYSAVMVLWLLIAIDLCINDLWQTTMWMDSSFVLGAVVFGVETVAVRQTRGNLQMLGPEATYSSNALPSPYTEKWLYHVR